MAEEAVKIPAVETTLVETPPATEPAKLEVQPALFPSVSEEDGEPGGADPQAVRARKEYRARKKAEDEARNEREQRIAAEARLKALEDRKVEVAPKSKTYTIQEIQEAVDAGTVTAVQAADYIARTRAEETAERVLNIERKRMDSEDRHGRATAQLREYAAIAPWITDKSDARARQLEQEYARLTSPSGLYRMEEGPVTDLLVLERMLGPLATLQKKADVKTKEDFHAETSAGGNAQPVKANGNSELAHMPKHFHEYWDRTGTSEADRLKEAKFYAAREAARKKA